MFNEDHLGRLQLLDKYHILCPKRLQSNLDCCLVQNVTQFKIVCCFFLGDDWSGLLSSPK